MPRTLNEETLRPHSPCEDGLALFLRAYPEGLSFPCDVEAEAPVVAKLAVGWAAEALLAAPALVAYRKATAAAFAAYDKALAAADAAYREATAAADAAYREATAPARAAYNEAFAAYDKAEAAARAAYRKAEAAALLSLLNEESNWR